MPPDELGAEMGPGVGIAGEVLRKRRPVLLARYGEIDNPTQREMLDNTVLGMPIRWRGRMIGFFGIGRSSKRDRKGELQLPRRFTRDDVATLETFARHAAIAIQNARQFAKMVEWGMTPIQAIRAATTSAAEALGSQGEGVGSIAPGKFGDMIAVSGDPLQDVRVLEHVDTVIKGGTVVSPAR